MKKILLFLVFGTSFLGIVAMDSDSGGDEDWLPTENSVMDESREDALADLQLPEFSPVNRADYVQPQQDLEELNPLSIQEAALLIAGFHSVQQPANPLIAPGELQSVSDPITDRGSDQEMQLLIPRQYPASQPTQEEVTVLASGFIQPAALTSDQTAESAPTNPAIESSSKKHRSAVAIEALAFMPAAQKKKYSGPTRECETCHKIVSAHNYKTHLLIHADEKPFICPYSGCSKSYTTPNALTMHLNTHTGKMSSCPICGKLISQPQHVAKHIEEVHNKAKPYICHVCHKAYSTKFYFNNHLQTKKHLKNLKTATSNTIIACAPNLADHQTAGVATLMQQS